VVFMGPGHAVHYISGVLCWFCLPCLCPLFCVERSLSGLHSDICDQWRVDVYELSEILFVNLEGNQECTRYHRHHPQEEHEMNSLKPALECQSRMSKKDHVNKLLVVLNTSSTRHNSFIGTCMFAAGHVRTIRNLKDR